MPDSPACVESPRYSVGLSESDGMSANLWLDGEHTHTIWCSSSEEANAAALLLANALNRALASLEVPVA